MSTFKQQRAAKILSENIGKPVGEAMREAGYSKETSETPTRLTESKAWPELLEQYIPDKLLARKHKLLLNAKKKVRKIAKDGEVTEYEEEDRDAIARGLDMGYKLKGHYKAEKHDINLVTPILGGTSKKDVHTNDGDPKTK